MHVDKVWFMEKPRYEYVMQRFGPLIKGRVLDVGCSDRQFEKLLPEGTQYVGVDVDGNPDYKLDLDATERLPFDDNSFDTVVCTDVLEHLDSLHRMFDELVRVSRGHVIISLPNCWRNLRKRIRRGTGTPRYYGLPLERPMSRHKWFFNVTDVRDFMQEMTRRRPVELVDLFVCEKPSFPLREWIRRAMYPAQERYLNRYADSIWTVLRKKV